MKYLWNTLFFSVFIFAVGDWENSGLTAVYKGISVFRQTNAVDKKEIFSKVPTFIGVLVSFNYIRIYEIKFK